MMRSYFKFLFRSLLWISAIIGGFTFTVKWNQQDLPSKLRVNSIDHLPNVKSADAPRITILINEND